jgi:predicted flap endonuclease-1-like 5' DNA nuclease
MTNVVDIEGIGPDRAEKLKAAGVVTTDDLLSKGGTPKGRKDLEAATGLSGAMIFRIKGVGTQYSDLLEASGVDTVAELAQRRADNLTKKMAEVNEQKKLVRAVPAESLVADWIEQSKALPRMVEY